MFEKEFSVAFPLILKAGQIVAEDFKNRLEVEYKEDGSPVTNIDKKIDSFLKDNLQKAFPSYGFLTEETVDDKSRLDKDYVWIIDPIDGTKELVKHEHEFVILVALAHKHEVVLSLIVEPIKQECYYAKKGEGAFSYINEETKRIHVSDKTKNLIATQSPYSTKQELDYLAEHKDIVSEITFHGAAYKACLIASGKADVCYRPACKCKEWDTAAPQLLVEEAGGLFISGMDERYAYNREDPVNYYGYIIINKKENLF